MIQDVLLATFIWAVVMILVGLGLLFCEGMITLKEMSMGTKISPTRTNVLRHISEIAVINAAEAQMFGTDNPGFCISCGTEHDACEPDMREANCVECKTPNVYGAEELMMYL